MKLSAERFRFISWLIGILAVLPAAIAWLQGVDGELGGLTAYELFPLFGLVAFTLMWSHYIVAALRLAYGFDKSVMKRFWQVTSWIVLGAIVLHPSLLIFTLWRDGFGLPPDSYLENYVAPSLKWAAALGSFSLLVFLAYELHRWFKDKSWWRYVQAASDICVFLILIHGFSLGGDLASGWFRTVWLAYAETYLIALAFIYYRSYKNHFKKDMVG